MPRICNAQNSIVGCLDITNIPEQNSAAKHGLARVCMCVSVLSTRNCIYRGFYSIQQISPVVIDIESGIIRVYVQKLTRLVSNLWYTI